MIALFADLDNTLIFSYKREIGPDKVCVEVYEGREISFMTRHSLKNLQTLCKKALVIPITTRSPEQYGRIRFPDCPRAAYALICNGGVLLRDGAEDPAWLEESRELAAKSRPALREAMGLLGKDRDVTMEVRYIRELFLFTKSANRAKTVAALEGVVDPALAEIHYLGEKVYVLPKGLDKGSAMDRLWQRLQPELTLAAGDSDFDLPMLRRANIALAPEALRSALAGRGDVLYGGSEMPFCDFVTGETLRLIRERDRQHTIG